MAKKTDPAVESFEEAYRLLVGDAPHQVETDPTSLEQPTPLKFVPSVTLDRSTQYPTRSKHSE